MIGLSAGNNSAADTGDAAADSTDPGSEATASAEAFPVTIEHAYGSATMRAEDHQIQQPLYISVVSDDVKYGVDNIDLGWKLVDAGTISMESAEQPTTCEMERPE